MAIISNFTCFFLAQKFISSIPQCLRSTAEGGLSLDSRSTDKELKAVTPDKSKACVTTFTKKVGA